MIYNSFIISSIIWLIKKIKEGIKESYILLQVKRFNNNIEKNIKKSYIVNSFRKLICKTSYSCTRVSYFGEKITSFINKLLKILNDIGVKSKETSIFLRLGLLFIKSVETDKNKVIKITLTTFILTYSIIGLIRGITIQVLGIICIAIFLMITYRCNYVNAFKYSYLYKCINYLKDILIWSDLDDESY